MTASPVLVLDVGTTTIKAFVFDSALRVLGRAKAKPKKAKPRADFIEQDPQELAALSKQVLAQAVADARVPAATIAVMGITNQRETVIAWDRETGLPLQPAIVWEDTRTRKACEALALSQSLVREKTGLPIDPYFSATKITWLLQQPAVAKAHERGVLLVGTVDAWILWNLSTEHRHATDYTNASRTLLFNIKTLNWDAELLNLFSIPQSILPRAHPSGADFGSLHIESIGSEVPIRAICGDQQASQYAAGAEIGATKATFGTGIFLSQSIGGAFQIRPPFFTTLIPNPIQPWYALEVKINESGTRVQALLDTQTDLRPLLREFANELNSYLPQLPHRPRDIVIDGGITQTPDLARILENVTGVKTRQHEIPDGTPLGVAKLLYTTSAL